MKASSGARPPLILLLLGVALFAVAGRSDPAPPILHVPRLNTPPLIDGVPTDAARARAATGVMQVRYRATNFQPVSPAGRFRIGYDAAALYLSVEMPVAPETPARATFFGRDDPAVRDGAHVGFVLGQPERDRYWSFMINANGAVYDVRQSESNGGYAWGRPDSSWNASDLDTAVRVNEHNWIVEAALPWQNLGIEQPNGAVFSFQVWRDRPGTRGIAWAPGPGYGLPITPGLVVMGERPADPEALERLRAAATQPTRDGAYLHEVSTRVVTPHVTWLKPNPRGAPKVLYLGTRPGATARFIVEMQQRADLEVVSYLHTSSASERDFWEFNVAGSSTVDKAHELQSKLDERYDVIVMQGFRFDGVAEAVRQAVRAKVEAGTGLVVLDGDLPWPGEPTDAASRIGQGIPFSFLPAYATDPASDWRAAAAAVIHPATLGHGRMVAVHVSRYGMAPESETYLDYHVALALNAVAWARPGPQPTIDWVELPEGRRLERSDLAKPLFLRVRSSADETRRVELHTTARTAIETVREWRQDVDLRPGDNDIRLTVPMLPAGANVIDLRLRSESGIECFGSFGLEISAPAAIASMALDPSILAPGRQRCRVSVTFTGPVPKDTALRLRVTDTYGRLEWASEHPLRLGATAWSGRLDLAHRVAQAHWVRAEVWAADEKLVWKQALLLTPRPRPVGFPIAAWGGLEPTLEHLRILRQYREIGFNLMFQGSDPDAARFAMLADMQPCHFLTLGSGVRNVLDGRVTIPGKLEDWCAKTEARAASLAPYGVFFYSLGDEIRPGPVTQPFSEPDRHAFRDYLQERFETVARLNRAWQTDHTSFDEIEPVDYAAADPDLLPQKIAREAYRDQVYIRAVHALCAAARRGDPDAAVGAEGSPSTDLELLLASDVGLWGPYRDRWIDMRLLSAARPGLLRGMWWGGYHFGAFDLSHVVRHFARQIYEGQATLGLFFNVRPGHHEGISGADLSLADWFVRMRPELERLLAGPAPLLTAAQYVDSGVYLLHSQTSVRIAHLDAPLGTPRGEALAAFHILDACGVNYRIMNTQEAAAGLDPRRVRLLILPGCSAVGPDLADALKAYVRRGGIVLAAGGSGVYDDNGTRPQRGPLDRLLGCRREGSVRPVRLPIEGTFQLGEAKVPFDLGRVWLDGSIVRDTAEVLLATGGQPAWTARKNGRGLAVAYHGSLGSLIGRGEAGLTAARDVMRVLLAKADVEPHLLIEPPGTARAYQFTLGKSTLISVLRNPDDPRLPRLRLPVERFVCDSDQGRQLGEVSALDWPDEDRWFGLYLIADRPVEPPALTLPRSARLGDAPALKVRLRDRRDSLVRIDAYAPDGARRPEYRRFARIGQPAPPLPLALNDPPGTWRITATDLASGLTTEQTLSVLPPKPGRSRGQPAAP